MPHSYLSDTSHLQSFSRTKPICLVWNYCVLHLPQCELKLSFYVECTLNLRHASLYIHSSFKNDHQTIKNISLLNNKESFKEEIRTIEF